MRGETSVAEQVREYLDQMDRVTLNMEEMSRFLGYSREHITRSFHAMYHVTPKQYITARIMNVALEELKKGGRVCEVAETLEYSSAYAFSKAFKNYFGLSPEKYLRTLISKL